MRLSSVRALKEELLSVPTELVEHVAVARSFRAFVASRETADRAMHRIALGVVPKKAKNDFRLAVRPQRSGPLISAMIQQIEREAKGEVDVQYIGDSGSLIIDEQLRAIGLLFAGGDEGGSNGQGLTYANPITTVLDEIQVDLEL